MKKFWFYTIFKKCLLFENFRLRRPQPDNREQREGGNDEACIAILNNFYSVSIIQKNTIFCQIQDQSFYNPSYLFFLHIRMASNGTMWNVLTKNPLYARKFPNYYNLSKTTTDDIIRFR